MLTYKALIFFIWLMGQAGGGLTDRGPVEQANRYEMTNGDVLKGEIASANEDGLVIKLDVGGFSERVSWQHLTQDTLKRLMRDPKMFEWVEPFVDIPLEVKARAIPKKRPITIQPVPRVDLPPRPGSFMATVTAPLNLAFLGLLFAANLFAAYEVAIYRRRPAALVCGVSALLPVIGPLLFLSLPGAEETIEEFEAPPTEADASARQTGRIPTPAGVSSSLSMAKSERTTGSGLEPAIYKRGEVEFNRRFFELKFSPYFRVVLSEAEKSMVIVVSTPRREFIATRIARISSLEVHLQLQGGAGEVGVPFGEITQVQLRPKDARG